MTFASPANSVVRAPAVDTLAAALAAFAEHTSELVGQDKALELSVDRLRSDLEHTKTRLHEEVRRRTLAEAHLGSMFSSAPFGLVSIHNGRVAALNGAAAALLPCLSLDSVWEMPTDWRRQGGSDNYGTGRAESARVVNVTCLLDDTDSTRQLIRLEDVTEMLRERENDARRDRLAAMGRMSAELAHQLRTPLCTATLYAGQLGEPGLDEAERLGMAQRLVGQLGQLDALITRMLSFVRTSVRAKEVSAIEPLVREQLTLIAPQMALRCLRLDADWQAQGCELAVDRLQIGSAVLALLENALQHAPHDSVISVRCLHAGHRVDIVVSDQGPGIAPSIVSSLFEPFASGRANGTGLGLAMARAAAQAHRGELNYSPRSPQGAEFTLSLPVLPSI